MNSNPPPPYDSALWDPGYSTDDSLPPLVDDSSTDGYDSSSSEESIPAHARYDVDSDIDDCRLGDHPSPDSEDELWNAEFWSTPDQGAYLLSPAAWASWQLANSGDDGNDHDDYHDKPDDAESDDDEFYGVEPAENTTAAASTAASTICRILASSRHQELSTWSNDPAVTVIDTAALSTAPVTLENYGRTVNLNTLIVSWAIHADIYRNRYIHQFCPEAIESLTCISNRDITDCLSSVRVHERMRQAISKILSHWIVSQLWERLLRKCRPDEILPAPPPDDDDHGGSPDAMLSARQWEAAASTAASDDQVSSEATCPSEADCHGSTRNCGSPDGSPENCGSPHEFPFSANLRACIDFEFPFSANLRACIDFRELGTSHPPNLRACIDFRELGTSGTSHSHRSGTSAVPTPTKPGLPSTTAPGVSPGLCFDHRDDHLLPVKSSHHSLLTASNSNREFLAHAVFLDNSKSADSPPCSSTVQVCGLWDSGSNTCLISPRVVQPHWQFVSKKSDNVVGVGGKHTKSKGIVMAPLRLVHAGVVKLVCCTVIEFHSIIVDQTLSYVS